MQVIAQRDDGVRILRIESQEEADPWRASFAGAYQAIWSEPPYNERFFPEEAEDHELHLAGFEHRAPPAAAVLPAAHPKAEDPGSEVAGKEVGEVT